MYIWFIGENLRALRFKSSYVFLKRPPGTPLTIPLPPGWDCVAVYERVFNNHVSQEILEFITLMTSLQQWNEDYILVYLSLYITAMALL